MRPKISGPSVKLAVVMATWNAPRPTPLYWTSVLDALAREGIDIEVIRASVKPLIRENEPPPGRRAYVPSMTYVHALLSSSAQTFLCVEYGIATVLCIALARTRRRRVIIFQEHCGRRGVPLARWERTYRRMLGKLSNGVVANTDAAFREIVEDLHIDRRKAFRASILVPPDRATLKLPGGLVPDPRCRPLFLFVGRLVQLKNVDGLLDAASTLRAKGLDFELWIVGDGPERQKLETDAADLTREGLVRFLGWWEPSTIGALYEHADVFVMPSFRDYRSVAVLEALRFGTPVIDSIHDGNTGDLVKHETTGLVFDPHDPDALSAAMARAVTEPQTVRVLGHAAAAAMEKQTPQLAATALRDILELVRAR
jgi:glycosyltransferase involved in cell wall biosynthesis